MVALGSGIYNGSPSTKSTWPGANGFWTLVIDLDTGRIIWAAEGRGAEALRQFWPALRSNRARIQAGPMDMSAAYWAAVAENLPEAAIVFDRFHITQLAN